jgi:hypothetical protein
LFHNITDSNFTVAYQNMKHFDIHSFSLGIFC